ILLLLYTLIFFYYYIDHRHLHSFPTRRSSDLSTTWPGSFGGRTRGAGCGSSRRVPSERRVGGSSATSTTPPPCRSCATGARFRPDRKSTRLNSSHVAISYAVFCLKKKTEA